MIKNLEKMNFEEREKFLKSELERLQKEREIEQQLIENERLKESQDISIKYEMLNDEKRRIQDKILSFFRDGIPENRFQLDKLLFELGDQTKQKYFDGNTKVVPFNKILNQEVDSLKYEVRNNLVEFAQMYYNKIEQDFRNRQGVSPHGHYQQIVRSKLREVNKKLTSTSKVRILKLMPYLLYSKKLDTKQISEIWGTAKNATSNSLKDIVAANVLIEEKVKNTKLYSFNSEIIFSGKSYSKQHTIKIYVDYLKKIIDNVEEEERKVKIATGKSVKRSSLATLFSVLPDVHFQTLQVVENAVDNICSDSESVFEAQARETREETSTLRYLSLNSLRKMSVKKTTDIEAIQKDLIILEQSNAVLFSSNIIQLNPNLVFSRNDKFNTDEDLYTQMLNILFEQNRKERERIEKLINKKNKLYNK